MDDKTPYIVLIGNTDSGKTAIFEKLIGEKNRSSEGFTSKIPVSSGSLFIANTPGVNALRDNIEHNYEIATAISFQPVSKIFIVVKAETRIDSVVDSVQEYVDHYFYDFPIDSVAVLVTKIDTVAWNKTEFLKYISEELEINEVVYSYKESTKEQLVQDILSFCNKKFELAVYGENFAKNFIVPNKNRKILKCTGDEVQKFSAMKDAFNNKKQELNSTDLTDLIYEFQAYIAKEIVKSKIRFSEQNNFTLTGDGGDTEAGHVANMVNQIHAILYDIMMEALSYQAENNDDLRKCPYCGQIWTISPGCFGEARCGDISDEIDELSADVTEMGTFSFHWEKELLKIKKSKNKNDISKNGIAVCGKIINWSAMAAASLPAELVEAIKFGVDDAKNCTEVQGSPKKSIEMNKQISVHDQNLLNESREFSTSIKCEDENISDHNLSPENSSICSLLQKCWQICTEAVNWETTSSRE